MLDPTDPLAKLLKEDKRFKLEAYIFIFEALGYAQKVLGLGSEHPSDLSEELPDDLEEELELEEEEELELEGKAGEEEPHVEKHVTGQELCHAIKTYALDQFGYMAKCVLNNWGIHKTGDFGDIVYNLIKCKKMKKTEQDRREDFDDVFDFETAFKQEFKIEHEA